MDILRKGFSEKARIKFTSVDVTMSAKALEARHLSGPVAGKVLGEGLVAIALLSAESSASEEAVSLHMTVDGPILGILVEATAEGDLRGYTNKKILQDLDAISEINTDVALGAAGNVQILKTQPGKILSQAAMRVDPPRFKHVVARYFNHSLQIPAAVEIAVRSDSGGMISARGMIAERMPDTDAQAFVKVLEAFNSGLVRDQLAKNSLLTDFRSTLGLNDIVEREVRDLRCRCRCSRKKAFKSFSALSREELQEIVKSNNIQNASCHLCGQEYEFPAREIAQLLGDQE